MSLSNLEVTSEITGNINFNSDFKKSAGSGETGIWQGNHPKVGELRGLSVEPVHSNSLGEEIILFRVRMFRALDDPLSC